MADDDEHRWYDDIGMAALLRAARQTYAGAIREGFAAAGFDDIPRNGAFVLSALVHSGSPFSEIISSLGVSKQAASQLIDALVLRGYVDRAPDPGDRRRMTVTLTERGRAAGQAVRDSVEAVTREVATKVGADQVAVARTVLAAIIEVGWHDHDHS